ncbi:hypothetical protein HK097_007103, partial [Rhizophlyctis rosea]
MTDTNSLANGANGTHNENSASPTADFDQQWATVEQNPDDFAAWERVLRAAESVGGRVSPHSPHSDITRVVEVYSKFLKKFPLCFGYWKKCVDWHALFYGPPDALKVRISLLCTALETLFCKPDSSLNCIMYQIFEEGVKAIRNSVDLWVQYLTFKIENQPEEEDEIRALFEQGLQFVGYDFMGQDFWDKYIEWEEKKENSDKVLAILERIIHIPLHQYNRYFEKYSVVAASRPVPELVTSEELERLQNEVRNPVAPQGGEAPPAPQTDEEIEAALRVKIHQLKSDLYLKTQDAVMKRWQYEGEIKRGYFHVKPLDEAQLVNWRKYLDFEEEQGDNGRLYALYERCLVACASYEEFWLRYARWAISLGHDAQDIFNRACDTFVPKNKPAVRLAYAGYQEEQGRLREAEEVYRGIFKNLPGSPDAVFRFAAFLRRNNRTPEIPQMFDEAVKVAPTSLTKGYLLSEKAKTMFNINNDDAAARSSMKRATQKHPDSMMAWIVWFLHEQTNGSPKDLRAVWEGVVASSLGKADKLILGNRYIGYLIDQNRPVVEINKLEGEIAKIRDKQEDNASRKRSLDEGDGRA